MAQFRVLVGRFAIVGTTGPKKGRRPACKSSAVTFDVIDRKNEGKGRRDLQFWAAWDFVGAQLEAERKSRLH